MKTMKTKTQIDLVYFGVPIRLLYVNNELINFQVTEAINHETYLKISNWIESEGLNVYSTRKVSIDVS